MVGFFIPGYHPSCPAHVPAMYCRPGNKKFLAAADENYQKMILFPVVNE
jgi:hypothetical protein